jgi:DNA polymerase-1
MTPRQSGSSIEDVRLHYVSTFEEIEGFWRWLGERHENDTIAVDIETTGLDHTAADAAIRLVQFGDMQQGWALPAQDWPGLCREVLQRWKGQFVGHNAVAFDGRWLRRFLGWEFPRERTVDTMIAAAIIDPISPVGLKPLSDKLIDPRASFGQDMLHRGMSDNGWTWATVPLNYEPYTVYSSMDVVLTAQLWDQFQNQVGPGKSYSGVMELEMNTRFIASAMEDRGLRIDVDYCSDQLERLKEFDAQMAEWAKTTYGISLSSNGAVAQRLVELGAPLVERTNGGALKVDKDILAFMANPDNGIPPEAQMLAGQVLKTRNARKVASTYFAAILERVQDGIIHPEIRTMGARTGRMSVSNPALQQLPKKDGYVRNAFIPRNPGELLVSCDYSQIEFRMAGNFSEDPGLIGAFHDVDAEGGDIFVNLGRDIYQEPDFQKSDKRRGLLKNTTYGKLYGASPAKMAATAGVPVDRMSEVVNAMDATYPGLKTFMKRIEAVGKDRERYEGQGYVLTPSGRRLPCDPDRVYTLTNYLIQSSAADVLKRALVRLDASEWGEMMLLPVHDEVVFSVPEDEVDRALKEIPEIMGEHDHPIPLKAEAEGGFVKWGDKYRD